MEILSEQPDVVVEEPLKKQEGQAGWEARVKSWLTGLLTMSPEEEENIKAYLKDNFVGPIGH